MPLDHLAARVAAQHLTAYDRVKLPVKAVSSQDGREFDHDVYILPDPNPNAPRPRGPVIQIDGTSGRWYVATFLQGSGRLAIDFGQDWYLENADEIRRVVEKIVPAGVLSVPDYQVHKREVAAVAKQAQRDLIELQGKLTTMADWVRDRNGPSEPKLRQASRDLEDALATVGQVLRLVR